MVGLRSDEATRTFYAAAQRVSNLSVLESVLAELVRQHLTKKFILRSMGKKTSRAYARFHRALRDGNYYVAMCEAHRIGIHKDVIVGTVALLQE